MLEEGCRRFKNIIRRIRKSLKRVDLVDILANTSIILAILFFIAGIIFFILLIYVLLK
jgi:hypothetical protein